MSSEQRREQLIGIARTLFSQKGFEGTSVEEIAACAEVSKPVVYEHFGGKEGLYAVVVDREMRNLHDRVRSALTTPGAGSRALIEYGAMALLDYLDENPDGFQILVRDSSVVGAQGTFKSLLADIVARVEDLMAEAFVRHDVDPTFAPLYSQGLVGLVAMIGQNWLDTREPSKDVVAAHVVNLAWNGMGHIVDAPTLVTRGD